MRCLFQPEQVIAQLIRITDDIIMQDRRDIAGGLRDFKVERAFIPAFTESAHDLVPFDIAQVRQQMLVISAMIVSLY